MQTGPNLLSVKDSAAAVHCAQFASKVPAKRTFHELLLLRRTGAECIGVFFLVLAACGSVMIGGLTGAYAQLGMTFSPGLVVMVMVAATDHLSMAHLKPAVTLAFSLSGHFSWREVPYYVVGQLVAAALGAAVLRLLFGNVSTLGANLPGGPIAQSLVMEVLVTASLMFVILAVATDRRAKELPAVLAIGGTVALSVLWTGPLSGASMNPARSFGPVLISGVWTAHWIYWVSPIIGAALGAFAYELVRSTEPGGV